MLKCVMFLESVAASSLSECLQDKRKQLKGKAGKAAQVPVEVLPVKHSVRTRPAEGILELSIESTTPIFCIAVASTVKVQFLEAPGSVAILTCTPTEPGAEDESLATYRCARNAS